MPFKSSITRLLQRLALFTVVLVVCYAENVAAQSHPFVNISTRAEVLNGQNVIVAGFIIQATGSATKQVLIRGMGPSYGLSLPDPTITLTGPSGTIYSNNNWKDDAGQQNAITAIGWQPGNDLESAILWTLPAGTYTVILGGNNGATGTGLVELYDMGGDAAIVNLSSRARVGVGDNALIAGVYVSDRNRAVIRAIGPTLGNYGVQGALQNPMLELYNAQGAQIASNDDWQSDPAALEFQRIGLQPANGSESAILPSLAPGPYTVIVRGVNNTSGIGMVELYALEPEFPKIFQNWADVTNLSEDRLDTVARHDLLWTTQNGFGWNWVDANGADTNNYRRETVAQTNTNIPYPIPDLRNRNPNLKILVQITLVSLAGDRLDISDVWWKRNASGGRVDAPGGGYLLDLDNPNRGDLRAHIAAQAAAMMQTGQFDGVMLDSVNQVNPSWLLPILTGVRNAIGEKALIIVNANADLLGTSELGQVNGVFMECGKVGTGAPYVDWQAVKTALIRNETYTRTPRVNCLQDWYTTSPDNAADLKNMRSITTLSLTHSNGYVNFGREQYYWYSFWSDHNLGFPLGSYTTMPGNFADRREFTNGTAIWNAAPNATVTVTFPQTRKSLATGQTGTTFSLTGIDGDIYLIHY